MCVCVRDRKRESVCVFVYDCTCTCMHLHTVHILCFFFPSAVDICVLNACEKKKKHVISHNTSMIPLHVSKAERASMISPYDSRLSLSA